MQSHRSVLSLSKNDLQSFWFLSGLHSCCLCLIVSFCMSFSLLLKDLLNSLLSLSIDLLKVWHSDENHHVHKEQSVSGLATIQ